MDFYTKLNRRKVFVEGEFHFDHGSNEERFEVTVCIDDITGLDVTLTESQELELEQDAFERQARMEREEGCYV